MIFNPAQRRSLPRLILCMFGFLLKAPPKSFSFGRGGSWWRSIPRIRVGPARILVAWLRRHAESLGKIITVDVELADPLVASAPIVARRGSGQLAPLERLALPAEPSGACSANRAAGCTHRRATHGLDAVRAYIDRIFMPPTDARSTAALANRESRIVCRARRRPDLASCRLVRAGSE